MLLNTSTEYLQCIMMTVVIHSKTNNQLPMIYTWAFYFVLFIRLPAAIVPPFLPPSLSLSLPPSVFPFYSLADVIIILSSRTHHRNIWREGERERERWEEEEKRKRKRERKYKYILKMLRQCVTNTNSVYT